MHDATLMITIVDYIFVPLDGNSIDRVTTTGTNLILPLAGASCDGQDDKHGKYFLHFSLILFGCYWIICYFCDMENGDYKNLRQKTVFDLCDDAELLHKLNPLFPDIETKEEWIDSYKEKPVNKAFDSLDLADMTNNLDLRKAVEKEWEKEFNSFFNE